MTHNAYVLDWTMDDYGGLKAALSEAGFAFDREAPEEHIRVTVPFARVEAFARLCQPHLNAPFNYIDVQYPDEGKTVIIFREALFNIADAEENRRVQQWAIAQGLPPAQADWGVSFAPSGDESASE